MPNPEHKLSYFNKHAKSGKPYVKCQQGCPGWGEEEPLTPAQIAKLEKMHNERVDAEEEYARYKNP